MTFLVIMMMKSQKSNILSFSNLNKLKISNQLNF